MRRIGWALTTYALEILLLLLLLFVHDPDPRLAIAFLLVANLAGLLVLLAREPAWDATHLLGLGLLLLTAPFPILFLALETTGVSYLYGAVLILASFVLFIVEIAVGWRRFTFIDDMMRSAARSAPREEPALPERKEKLLAKGGTTVYHRESCPLIAKEKIADLIHLSSEDEAMSLGLEPCATCRP